MKKTLFLSILTILVRFLDSYVTYAISPELTGEQNPLVKFLNGGWGTLIITDIIVCSACIIAFYVYDNQKEKIRLRIINSKYTVNNIKDYIGLLYYGNPTKYKDIYTKMPVNKKVAFIHLFYVLAITHLFFSAIIIISNLGIIFFYDAYKNLCDSIGGIDIPKYLIFIALIIVYFVYKRLFKHEFLMVKENDKEITE